MASTPGTRSIHGRPRFHTVDMPETLGRRLDRALLALQLRAQGSATDYGREVISSTPEKAQEPPPVDLTAEAWAEQARRLVEAGERLVDGEHWSPVMSISALKLAVRPLAGRSSGFAAYALGQPLERVQAARAALDVDTETGPPKPKPLTSRELPAARPSVDEGMNEARRASTDVSGYA